MGSNSFASDGAFICRLEFAFIAIVFLLYRTYYAPLYNIISDCDEIYNYWEPVHFISFLPFGTTRHPSFTSLQYPLSDPILKSDHNSGNQSSVLTASALGLPKTLLNSENFNKLHNGSLSISSSYRSVVDHLTKASTTNVGNNSIDSKEFSNAHHREEHPSIKPHHPSFDISSDHFYEPNQSHDRVIKGSTSDLNKTLDASNIDHTVWSSNVEPLSVPYRRLSQFENGSFILSVPSSNTFNIASSMQTWEYSPDYALRSYVYVLFHCCLVWTSQLLCSLCPGVIGLVPLPKKIEIFFMTRRLLSLIGALIELGFANSLKLVFGRRIATLFLLINLLSPGTFLASNQMLPSTSCMLIALWSFSRFLKFRFRSALSLAVGGTIVCWPFVGVIYVPLGLVALRRFGIAMTLRTILQSLLSVLFLVVAVDYVYYGKFVITPINIVTYNTGFGHGSSGAGKSVLYGIESWTFYIKNLLLNFHIFFILAGLGILVMTTSMLRSSKPFVSLSTSLESRKTSSPLPGAKESMFVLGAPILIWGVLMNSLPHKEERFLSPLYPLLCVSAAIAIDWMIARPITSESVDDDEEAMILKKQDDEAKGDRKGKLVNETDVSPTRSRFGLLSFAFFRGKAKSSSQLQDVALSLTESSFQKKTQKSWLHGLMWCMFWITSTILCGSRIIALQKYYWEPVINIWATAAERSQVDGTSQIITICTGNEWFRFPSSFFLPSNAQLGFVRSGFIGLLPGKFEDTRKIPLHMNDENKEELKHYTPLVDCDYLVDSSSGISSRVPCNTMLQLNNATFTEDATIVVGNTVKKVDVLDCHPLIDATRRHFLLFFVQLLSHSFELKQAVIAKLLKKYDYLWAATTKYSHFNASRKDCRSRDCS